MTLDKQIERKALLMEAEAMTDKPNHDRLQDLEDEVSVLLEKVSQQVLEGIRAKVNARLKGE